MWDEVARSAPVKYGAVTAVTVICIVLLRKWIAGGVCQSSVQLRGKTVLVTGANTGIGKETCHDMARRGKIQFDDLFFAKRPYNSLVSYRQSKLANVLFSRELARRLKGTGVTSYSLHPGVIRTELTRHVETWFPMLRAILSAPSVLLMKTPTQGAQTSIYCAVTPGLEHKSGSYFSDCAMTETAPGGRDDAVAKRLWKESARLVGYIEKD